MITLPREILLGHGGGGQLMDQLLDEVVRPVLGNEILNEGLDSGIVQIDDERENRHEANAESGKQKADIARDEGCATFPNPRSKIASHIALTIDSYVVTPWSFPGGDIGRLAVCGTVNDLSVCGARPLGMALSLIIAEGFEVSHLRRIMESIAQAANEAGVKVVTGDTKVVGRHQADGIYITTAGVGLCDDAAIRAQREGFEHGDVLLINGPIADHGLAVMLAREMPHLKTPIRSDVAPLNGLIRHALESGIHVRFMRDATRAGLAGVCADLAKRSGRRVLLEEIAIHVRPETRHAADMLGLDVLEVANEGKVVMVVPRADGEKALARLREHPLGKDAAIIGELGEECDGICELRTVHGGSRVVTKPYGEQLPRIC